MLAIMNISLDHLGVVSAQRNSLRHIYLRLGFDVTEPEELLASDSQGRRSSLGQSSCHAVMHQGYIELSEVYSGDPAHHLAAYLQRGPGLLILALGTDDIGSAYRQCQSAGLACSEVRWATRPISYGERHGAARFEWFMVDAQHAPDGLVCVVRNHTPELVYQRQVMQHPNGAVALRGLVVACRDVDAAADRYARITGAAIERLGQRRCIRLDDAMILLT
jgi:Glyoxalase-like domain